MGPDDLVFHFEMGSLGEIYQHNACSCLHRIAVNDRGSIQRSLRDCLGTPGSDAAKCSPKTGGRDGLEEVVHRLGVEGINRMFREGCRNYDGNTSVQGF
jgi:hypothetical protein